MNHEHDHGSSSRLASMEGGHFWFAGRDRLVRCLIERHGADRDEVVLDLGSGTGRFARNLHDEGWTVLAVDAAPGDQGPPGATVAADGERLPLAAESVGTVLARDVLEHVDDVTALRECARVLHTGGLLVVLVPAWPSLWSDRDVRAGHRRRYRGRALRMLVEAAGFDVVEQRGYQLLLLPAVVATRVASRAAARVAGSRWGPQVVDREERPSRWLNRVLTGVNTWEGGLARWGGVRPPTGSTLVVVARRGERR